MQRGSRTVYGRQVLHAGGVRCDSTANVQFIVSLYNATGETERERERKCEKDRTNEREEGAMKMVGKAKLVIYGMHMVASLKMQTHISPRRNND